MRDNCEHSSFGFRKLKVWQKGIALVKAIYEVTEAFPDREKFGLSAQLRSAAVSFPGNIAEGAGRFHSKDFLRFVAISSGSLNEIESHLFAAFEVGFLKPRDLARLLGMTAELRKMINSLRSSLMRRIKNDNNSTLDTEH